MYTKICKVLLFLILISYSSLSFSFSFISSSISISFSLPLSLSLLGEASRDKNFSLYLSLTPTLFLSLLFFVF